MSTDPNADIDQKALSRFWSKVNTYFEGGARRCRACREARKAAARTVPPSAERTHCPQGHPYNEENTYRRPNGDRSCRTCRREQARQSRQSQPARHKAQLPPPARADEPPLSPDYEHPECGFHWRGRDGMDIPMRDGQPVCPRCELAKVQTKLDYTQRRRDEVGAECKRRGKIKLEQAERIARLERQLDEVRTQLGAEILRAGQTEAALERIQRVIRRLANHAVGFQDVLDDSDFDPWAKTVGADIAELRRLADEAQQPESSVHGESVAHLAGIHDDEDPNTGPGWYEVINPRNATTNIAYVQEDGSLYLPEGDDLTPEEFAFAAARGNAHLLVRVDDREARQ